MRTSSRRFTTSRPDPDLDQSEYCSAKERNKTRGRELQIERETRFHRWPNPQWRWRRPTKTYRPNESGVPSRLGMLGPLVTAHTASLLMGEMFELLHVRHANSLTDYRALDRLPSWWMWFVFGISFVRYVLCSYSLFIVMILVLVTATARHTIPTDLWKTIRWRWVRKKWPLCKRFDMDWFSG